MISNLVTVMEKAAQVQNAWHPEDALFYPLQDEAGNPIGLISLDAPRDGQRPDQAVLEVLEIFSVQAALVIQNKRRISTYQAQVETLSTSLDRQQQLLSISQSHLPNLLHKDLEQMISIRNLNRRARRIRAGLEITDAINRQVDGPSALQALGREILTRLDMSVSIVAREYGRRAHACCMCWEISHAAPTRKRYSASAIHCGCASRPVRRSWS